MVKKANVMIIEMPVKVVVSCPYCDKIIKMDYDDFENSLGNHYTGDWKGQILECNKCKNKFEINDSEWY